MTFLRRLKNIMNGLVIVGYQGIGKSSIKNHPKVIDFESSLFKINGERDDSWPVIYARQAVSMAEQGYIVLVSSHAAVRSELSLYGQEDIAIVTITPDISLKNAWCAKLESRYESDRSEKNHAAWKNAVQCYEENIKDIASEPYLTHIYIHDMTYSLFQIIRGLEYIYDI